MVAAMRPSVVVATDEPIGPELRAVLAEHEVDLDRSEFVPTGALIVLVDGRRLEVRVSDLRTLAELIGGAPT